MLGISSWAAFISVNEGLHCVEGHAEQFLPGPRVRRRLFDAILSQDIGFFDLNKTGDLSSRLNNDCSTVRPAVFHACVGVVCRCSPRHPPRSEPMLAA